MKHLKPLPRPSAPPREPDAPARVHPPTPPSPHVLLDRLCAPSGHPSPAPRTLLVVAHPDDESVSTSSRLTRIQVAGVLYATDGAPRDGRDARAAGCQSPAEYAQIRRAETLRALAHTGISSEHAVFLDHPDQQASFHLDALTEEIRHWIATLQPEVVLTHPYEGGHPDHDAVAFATHAALMTLSRDVRADTPPNPPVLVEFTSYHALGDGWVFGEFLPNASADDERVVGLTADTRTLKQRLLACHRSQAETLSYVPVDQERFRLAPAYDFTRPPHEGQVLYERYPWNMTSRDWCALAAAAAERLQLSTVSHAA